jgi:hypothetical protein
MAVLVQNPQRPMVAVSQPRFNALAGYTRKPEAMFTSRELEWYSDVAERVLGLLIEDRVDRDFGGIVLGRDARRRFRAVDVTTFSESKDAAREKLRDSLESWSRKPDAEFHQGDEKGTPMDVFTPVVPSDRFHPAFLRVATGEGFSPAREIIEAMMPYYEDVDGNFVEQFKTTGFDARFWELYLFAFLHEQGFAFNRHFSAPDFFCERFLDKVFVEAVTVNPTVDHVGLIVEPAVPEGKEAFAQYYQEYMPMKWGSALTSKLKKEYWNLTHVRNRPIVLAIQDFHVPRAMTFLANSIASYLYGISFAALYDERGNLAVKSVPRGPHSWRGKTIETGFFSLSGSENISAVLTNPTATISKVNRMAYLAGFGSRSVKMTCVGNAMITTRTRRCRPPLSSRCTTPSTRRSGRREQTFITTRTQRFRSTNPSAQMRRTTASRMECSDLSCLASTPTSQLR